MPVENILVRGPNWIGDLVLASGFFSGLRQRFPVAKITIAIPENTVGVLDPGICDSVLALKPEQRKLPSGIAFWHHEIAARSFDLGITLAASFSAAALLRASGISVRMGYSDWAGSFLLTRSSRWKGRASGKHKSLLYTDLLGLLPDGPSGSAFVPTASQALENSPIVLAPGASISLREWPGFVELCGALRKKFPDRKVLIVGAADQKGWDVKFRGLFDPQVESRIGRTTLPELITLCRAASLVVANDSGVAHLAATLAGAPTVVLFGPGDPHYVKPLGPTVEIARATDVPCSPCEKPTCHARFGYKKCLQDLRVDQVLGAIDALTR